MNEEQTDRLIQALMDSEAANLPVEQIEEAVDSMVEELNEEVAVKVKEAHEEGVKYVDVETRTEIRKATKGEEFQLPFSVKYNVVKTNMERITPGCSRRIHVHELTGDEVAEII